MPMRRGELYGFIRLYLQSGVWTLPTTPHAAHGLTLRVKKPYGFTAHIAHSGSVISAGTGESPTPQTCNHNPQSCHAALSCLGGVRSRP